MSAAADWPLTTTVVLPAQRGGGGPVHALISAFCSCCGTRRTVPPPGAAGDGWVNLCGHVDTWAGLRAEIDAQCARPTCVILAGYRFHPYCTFDCAVAAAVELAGSVAALQAAQRLLHGGGLS